MAMNCAVMCVAHVKDGRWEGRSVTGHTENGRATFRYFYGRSYREVKEKLRNQNTQKQATAQPRLHYSDILDAWLQSKRLSVKESSYGKYRHTKCLCYFLKFLFSRDFNFRKKAAQYGCK
mgnify:CR=1 FL=1